MKKFTILKMTMQIFSSEDIEFDMSLEKIWEHYQRWKSYHGTALITVANIQVTVFSNVLYDFSESYYIHMYVIWTWHNRSMC